jgi:hypothetical protein
VFKRLKGKTERKDKEERQIEKRKKEEGEG